MKGWLKTTLGNHVDIITGYPFKSELYTEAEKSIRLLRGDNIIPGSTRWDGVKYWSLDKVEGLNKYYLNPQDLIIAMDRVLVSNGLKITIIQDEDVPALLVQRVARLRASKGLDQNFLPYLVMSHRFEQYVKSVQTETAIPHISTQQISDFPIVLPPLLEQCRIAEMLGVWDESIDLLERLIGKTRSRKQGLMQQLLTGKKRFKEFEGSEWKIIVFNQIIDKCFDYRGRTPLKIGMEWGDGNIPALSASNVRMGKIDFDRECYFASTELYKKWMTQGDLEKGDVLLTTEAPLGTVAQVPDNELYILSQRVIAIRPKPELLNKSFLFHSMISKEFQDELDKNSSGSTAKGIQRKRLEKIIIKIPSLPEQEKIAAVLSAADEEISTLEKQLAAYKQQKLGLMQQLLTGKIRVGMI